MYVFNGSGNINSTKMGKTALIFCIVFSLLLLSCASKDNSKSIANNINVCANQTAPLKVIECLRVLDVPEKYLYSREKVNAKERDFVYGYLLFFNGKIFEAESRFQGLLESSEKNKSILGAIGLSDVAVKKKNVEQLSRYVSELTALSREIAGYEAEALYYNVILRFHSAKFDELEPLMGRYLERYPIDETLAYINYYLLVRENELDKAKKHIRDVLGSNPEFIESKILAEADFIEIVDGYHKSLLYIEKAYQKNINGDGIKLNYIIRLLNSEEPDRDKVVRLASDLILNEGDLDILLILANSFIDADVHEGVAIALDKINELKRIPSEFSEYRLLMAKMSRDTEGQGGQLRLIDQVIEMNPTNTNALWSGYYLSLYLNEDPEKYLKKLLHIDQYDVYAIYEYIVLLVESCRLKDTDFINKIMLSKRYVPEYIQTSVYELKNKNCSRE